MYILSFDVGIKNLAYCLLHNSGDQNYIVDWGVADLSGDKRACNIDTCNKKATHFKAESYFCSRHAKQFLKDNPSLSLPSFVISKSLLGEISSVKLRKFATQLDIPTTKVPTDEIRMLLCDYIDNHLLESVVVKSAKDIDLVEIGRALHRVFTQKAIEWNSKDCIPEQVLIENQISPIANRMKTIQGMLAQFFISAQGFVERNIQIKFVSSSNKLKDFVQDSTTYEQRKKMGVEVTRSLLCETDVNKSLWLDVFDKHSKKDDLADSYLQGIWYIKHCV